MAIGEAEDTARGDGLCNPTHRAGDRLGLGTVLFGLGLVPLVKTSGAEDVLARKHLGT